MAWLAALALVTLAAAGFTLAEVSGLRTEAARPLAADATLYEAKRGGRNRVVLSADGLPARGEASAG
jgi:hypothetical protein